MPKAISRVRRPKEQARYVYDRLSRWYDLIAGPGERRARDRGLRRLGARPGEVVLEVGFGTGHGLVALARSVGPSGRVFGVDLSPGMCRVASSRVRSAGLSERVELLCGDGEALPFPAELFDAAFMSFTLELFDTPEIPRVLAECRRVLKSGGRLVVVALSQRERPGLMMRLYERAHRAFPAYFDCRPIYVEAALEEAGFQIVSVEGEALWGLPVAVVLSRSVKGQAAS